MHKLRSALLVTICLINAGTLCGQDYPTAKAPPNLAVVEHTSTGVMYADKDLVKEYKQLKEQVGNLRAEVFQSAEIAGDSREELAAFEKELAGVATKIDETKVHVQPFGVFLRRDTQSFELGAAEQIVITSDDLIVRGWKGKNIKCVVEKFILSEEEPDESEFEAIVVKHETRLADDLVGMSDEARQAGEKEFLESEAGKKLTAEGRQNRAKFVAEIHNSYGMYRPLQGHDVDVLQIVGLTGQEGNQHLTGRTESPGGSATLGSYWKRSAKVTIYVPECQHVVLRGCEKMVDIKSVRANLILTTHGSHDSQYGSDFAIRDIDGDVGIYQAPIRILEGVRGNVDIRQTDEFINFSTIHRGKLRKTMSPPPDPRIIRDVTGNLRGEFVRADLQLQNIFGTIDVINEYGNTELLIDNPLSPAAHRVLSHSGVVRAITPKPDSAGIHVYAFSQTGTAQVAFSRDKFEDRAFAGGGRSWYGFQSVGVEFGFFAIQRPRSAWENEPRANGLDLISNSGAVIVGPAEKL